VIARAAAFALALAALGGPAAAQPPAAPPPLPGPPASASATAAPPAETSRFRLAAQTDTAVGLAPGPFVNQLLGARLDCRLGEAFSLGGYLGYANLRGKEGRVHQVLPYAMLEYRVPLAARPWLVPMRFAAGYLPSNGPFTRLSAGLGYALGPRTDLIAEIFAPTLWFSRNQAAASLDLALEIAFKLDR
jgi:hypothetical protein